MKNRTTAQPAAPQMVKTVLQQREVHQGPCKQAFVLLHTRSDFLAC